MINAKQRLALVGLRTTVSLVVMVEAIVFLYSSPPAAAHIMPGPIRLVFGWGEVAGALLFLIPRAVVIGGSLLIAIFGFAALVHLAHGQFGVGALVIYIAAVITVLSHHRQLETQQHSS
jgi:hypothetical protein